MYLNTEISVFAVFFEMISTLLSFHPVAVTEQIEKTINLDLLVLKFQHRIYIAEVHYFVVCRFIPK